MDKLLPPGIIHEVVSAKTLSKKAGMLRRAAEADVVIKVTFHGQPMSRVVPDARWQRVEDDLAAAQKQVERLRAALFSHGISPEEAAVV